MTNGGVKSQVRAITIQHEREEVLDSFATRSHFDCLVEEWKDREGMWQQTNIGARDAEEAANTMKIQAECEGPMWWREDSRHKLGRWSKSHLSRYDMVERHLSGADSARAVRGKNWDHNLLNRCKPEKDGHERAWKDVKTDLNIRRGNGSRQKRERVEH